MRSTESSRVHNKGGLSISHVFRQVRENPNFRKAGAIGMFIGVVRSESPLGENVRKLEIEAYEEKANEVLENICKELQKKRGIIDVQIYHFVGEFEVSEDLVYVMVAGAHRHQVFSVLEEAVERYKKEAPIFKKEYIQDKKGTTRSYWVSEHKTS